MTNNLPVSQQLTRAIDFLEAHEWTKGSGWLTVAEPDPRQVCLEGAVQAGMDFVFPVQDNGYSMDDDAHTFFTKTPTYKSLLAYAKHTSRGSHRLYGESLRTLWQWNDRVPQTKEEVIELLHNAATEAARKESDADE